MSSPSAGSREWLRFFDAHAPHYDQNGFAQHTLAEVDFLLTLYPILPGATILDVGCGTGRHSIELAKRGFNVTGVDLSSGMLAEATRKAAAAGVEVRWIQADATTFRLADRFDVAICLCEGGVGLIERGEDAEAHDGAIFARIAECLKPNAPFVLTALNGYSIIRQMKDEHVQAGRFDPATMVANYEDEWDLPEGQKLMTVHERLFIPPEVVRMLTDAGFTVDNVYGGTAGHWARRFLSLDEIEAMYLCRRKL
ncbi:MAG: methyltransferase domain-containing protein [Fimbriimonas sp.]|nr:methyltransferase domain-containing protein [Fimbriimonas sp.]